MIYLMRSINTTVHASDLIEPTMDITCGSARMLHSECLHTRRALPERAAHHSSQLIDKLQESNETYDSQQPAQHMVSPGDNGRSGSEADLLLEAPKPQSSRALGTRGLQPLNLNPKAQSEEPLGSRRRIRITRMKPRLLP